MKKGFTLLELIVVIIIIGILSAFAVPQFFRTAERSRTGEATSILGTLRAAQMRYYTAKSSFTTVLAELDVDTTTPRYFTVTLQNPAYLEGNTIVTALRNGLERPGSIAAYTLTITIGGTIACSPAADCAMVGY